MGTQQFGAKKVAKLNRKWGWNLDMIWNTQGTTTWYRARTPGDHHVEVNVKTGDVRAASYPHIHATSCPYPYETVTHRT